jgi:hypothetical protein
MKSTDQKYYLSTMFIVQGKYFITLGESGFYLANPVVAKLPLSICRCRRKHRGASRDSVVWRQQSIPDATYIAL